MSETKRELFSEEAIERVLSPERLDGYLQVVRPSAWIAVVALALFVAGALIWGLTGSISQTLSATGLVHKDGSIVGYIPVEQMPSTSLVGREARVTTAGGTVLEGTVAEVSAHPLSQEEVAGEQTDAWMAYLLATSPFEYRVTIDATSGGNGVTSGGEAGTVATEADTIAEVAIVTREDKLISFLFN
jgi:hypothetical protein